MSSRSDLRGADSARPGSRLRPLSVERLIGGTTNCLERNIGEIYVAGEVGSLSRAASGHCYFSLCDQRAQIRCVVWKRNADRFGFALAEGLAIVCRGTLGIYPRDGKLQLYVQSAEESGRGAEALALEALRRKLAAEGLFDPARKRPLPRLPRRIGVVTSRSGAAIRDVVRAVHRRCPVDILLADARVQGAEAPRMIAEAIRNLCETDVDLIIVGRGGGSASDLAAFNDERVVRAVAECSVPTISAVGHEVDISLTDLVADARASTPTAAGEMAVPDRAEWRARLEKEERRLGREMSHSLRAARQELDGLAGDATGALRASLARRRRALDELWRRLEGRHPRARLGLDRARLRELEVKLDRIVRLRLERGRRSLSTASATLDALSPLRVLDRGFALATADGALLRDARDADVGELVELRLRRGSLSCRVEGRTPAAEGG